MSSYVLRYRPIPSISSMDYTPWQMATLDETETDTTLTSLLPGAIYLLSVAASNQIGTSPFSESAVALTNPPGENTNKLITTSQLSIHIKRLNTQFQYQSSFCQYFPPCQLLLFFFCFSNGSSVHTCSVATIMKVAPSF